MSTSDLPDQNTILIHDDIDPRYPHRQRISLSRPDQRNALDLKTMEAMIDAIAAAKSNPILITAAPPAFCAGLDLKEILAIGSPETHLRKLVTLLVAISEHPNSTMCYVQGAVRAGGVALACCADRVVAHPNATFMIPGEEFYEPMAAILSPILAARRNLPLEKVDDCRGCLQSAETAKSLGFIDEICEDQKQAAATLTAEHIEKRSITPTILQEVNARIANAMQPSAIAPLIEHLRKRFGQSS